MPIALAFGLVALVGALATIGSWHTPAVGPMPSGQRIADGVVLSYEASDGATAIVAEIRGLRLQPGGVRETLWVAREPFEKSDFEALGRGAALGEISPDGRFVSWLATKERGHSTGPGRLRGVEKDAPVIDARALLPPVLFDGSRAAALTAYQASAGRGTLMHVDFDAGTSKILSPNIPGGGFGLLDGGRTFALRRPYSAVNAEAVVLGPAISPAIPLTANVDVDGPPPAFRIAPDRRAVTMRLAPDADGRRALVRWKDGVAGLAPVAPDAAAWTLDRDGVAWWVAVENGAVRAYREGAELLGEIAGRDPVSVHPLPASTGVWVALADRPCIAEPAPTPVSGGAAIVESLARERGVCTRLVVVGVGDAPPVVEGLRRVAAAPEGWPVALIGPVGGHPALIAVGDPRVPLVVEDGSLLSTVFSRDGRFVGARLDADDGERIVLVDLTKATTTLLAEQAPESLMSWNGDVLVYAWRNRWWRSDPRNGLYRVRPAD